MSTGSGAYTVLSDDPTIEHIMPQTVTEAWKHHLGENWQQDYGLLHTLGNLTVVTQDWNSLLSNSSYDVKRQKLADHGLLLNHLYFTEQASVIWNCQSIRERAQWLVTKVSEIWPQLAETVGSWEEKPKAVVILDDVYPVGSWRDVLRRTSEVAAQWSGDKFEDQVVAELPTIFSNKPFSVASHQLQNGWWININWSADTIKQICTRIVQAIAIPEDEYDVELW